MLAKRSTSEGGEAGLSGCRKSRRRQRFPPQRETYKEVEAWYDMHPEATFGEIEEEVREKRPKLMGKALEILGNGRDKVCDVEGTEYGRCRQRID